MQDKRTTTHNMVLPKWRQKCYYETFVLKARSITNLQTIKSHLYDIPKKPSSRMKTATLYHFKTKTVY